MYQAVKEKPVSRLRTTAIPETFTGNSGTIKEIRIFGEITGKELDPETGMYYFGARYLDPRTSRWISADPAMAEYIPQAPINDEAKKYNQNLPGMGGIFNYVNMHVYHYAGNNPIKLVDPDGRESGYVRRQNSVGFQGHAGVFARNSNGKYVFTEIIPIKDRDTNYNPDILTKKENINTGAFPISEVNKNDIGAIQYTFNDYDQMLKFFSENKFTDFIKFNTSSEQDAAIIEAATQLGREYTNYLIPGNHCGIFAERALDAGGKGIKTNRDRNTQTDIAMSSGHLGGFLVGRWLQSPNSIGNQLKQYNDGEIVKIPKYINLLE